MTRIPERDSNIIFADFRRSKPFNVKLACETLYQDDTFFSAASASCSTTSLSRGPFTSWPTS